MIAVDSLQLVERCRAGEAQALETFVAEHQALVFRLALSILDDPQEAEEAAQDALLSALRGLDSFRGDSALTTWLYAITLNVCRGRLRRRGARLRLRQALEQMWPFHAPREASPEDQTIRQQADAALWAAVSALDEKHRLPVILRYYHDLPVAEIARLLGLPDGTVHSRLNTARARLRDQLGEQDD